MSTDKPLLGAGLHKMKIDELDNHFLSNFSGSATRQDLLKGLSKFIDRLKKFGLDFEVWLDGSFVTEKLDPNDIDLVVFVPQSVSALDVAKQQELHTLLVDRASAKKKFGCDVFMAVKGDANHRSYWRGWYGFDRDEKPKGIARVDVS
jgi:hypothetical protein